jgi:predicted permease
MSRTPRRLDDSSRLTDQPHAVPRLPLVLLRRLLPAPERDELLADLVAEYVDRATTAGPAVARRWLWRQTIRSVPALVRWGSWREWTGFEPRANAFRPGGFMLATWFTDARYAARRLRTRPAYAIVAVLTLALGVGGTAAIFGIARPLVVDPLPYASPDEIGVFWMTNSWNEEEFTSLRGTFPGFRSVAAYRDGDVTMRDGDAPARLIPGIRTSAELFDVLAAPPFLGPGFTRGDDAPTAEPVAVLSFGLWEELGGDRSIIGQRVTIDGAPRTVVGVMPRGFWFPDPAIRIWVSHPLNPEGRSGSWTLVGRVAAGQRLDEMTAPLARLTAMLGERFDYPVQWDKTRNASVTPIRDAFLGTMRPAILATFAAMALILLMACANVAALMLGQVEGRATEMAVRAALGASRRRLMQQLIVEGVLVGLASAAVGGFLAIIGFRLLARTLPLGAWGESAVFDWTIFAAALAAALIAAALVVIVPLIALWRGEVRDALSGSRTGGIHGRGGRLERGLVVAEVALAMLIVSGAALLARSVAKLYAIEPGVATTGIAVIDVVASAELTAAQRRQALDELTTALAALPGARSAAAAMKLPLRGNGNSFGITIEGRPEVAATTTFFRLVTRDYFETMGFQLRTGRTFDTSDRFTNEIPIVVNEAFGRKYFPGANPVDQVVGGGFGVPQRIIGVVADAAEGGLTDPPEPARYYLGSTVPWFSPRASLVIRASRTADAESLLDEARRTIQRVAPSFGVQRTTTMARILDTAVGPARQVMSLLSLLSGLAVVLGAIGIYGVIAHFAARRKRDWAIRVALGLPGARVVTHIVRQGIALVAAGIVLGAAGAVILRGVLTSFLFGVSAVDPLAFGMASAALLLVGVVAAFVPAWRAGSVDPALVLREQ